MGLKFAYELSEHEKRRISCRDKARIKQRGGEMWELISSGKYQLHHNMYQTDNDENDWECHTMIIPINAHARIHHCDGSKMLGNKYGIGNKSRTGQTWSKEERDKRLKTYVCLDKNSEHYLKEWKGMQSCADELGISIHTLGGWLYGKRRNKLCIRVKE